MNTIANGDDVSNSDTRKYLLALCMVGTKGEVNACTISP